MPVGIQGLRGIGEFSADFRPTNYREMYTLLEPNGTAPFNALLSMTSGEATDDAKFNHFRDEVPERTLKINDVAGYNTSATALTIDADDDVGFVTINTLIVNSATGEVMRATADASGTTLTVSRNVGGTSYSITDNDDLFVAGFAAPDGADVGTAISFDATVAYNYCQTFRTPYALTNRMKATYRRNGDAEDEYAMKALKLHMQDIERAFFFGNRHEENGSTATPRTYTGGITTLITQLQDAATWSVPNTSTEDEFDRLLIETIFAFGSKQKLAFVGAKVAGHLQAFGKNRWQPTQVQGTYGVNVTKYQTTAGDLMVHLHPQFRQIPSMANAMVILDLPYIKYRHMEGRDTQLLRDRGGNGADASTHEYLTDCGLDLLQDKVHTYISNWTTIA